jgi:hypothetical protein
MTQERSTAKFVGWLGGIAATVISGYLLWYFTQPKPTPPPPPPPAVTTLEGMVYSGSAPVAKAMVAVNVTGAMGVNGAVHDITDDHGAYRFDFTGLPKDADATVSVTAPGYDDVAPVPIVSPLQADNRKDIALTPTPTVAAPGPQTAAPAVQTNPAKIPFYVRKSAAEAMKFRVPVKKP